MSATTIPEYEHRLNLAEQVARIERMQEETRKFAAEQRKLLAEQTKFGAEAAKLSRDRFLAYAALGVALLAALGGALAGLPTLLKLAKGVPL